MVEIGTSLAGTVVPPIVETGMDDGDIVVPGSTVVTVVVIVVGTRLPEVRLVIRDEGGDVEEGKHSEIDPVG